VGTGIAKFCTGSPFAMPHRLPLQAIRARWIVPISSPPVAHGLLTMAGGRIVSVGENLSGRPPLDLGSVAVLPGFVNPHTHLEFSGLTAPLGQRGQRFSSWIREVVDWRKQWRDTCDSDSALVARRQADVESGLEESRQGGVALLGEIATPGWPAALFSGESAASLNPATRPAATVFFELLGLASHRLPALLDLARQHVRQANSSACSWRPGLSPHAPYTAGVELVRTVCQWSAAEGWPVAMHLAESPDELELLQSHSGPLVELLSEWDAWDPSAVPRGVRPTDYLEMLATASRALVIHGNYLGSRDWQLLAEHRDRLTVVFCPRTHDYFGHAEYPLCEMLAAGVAVAVGTDSRATNPDLNPWDELRFVRRRYPTLSPRTILELGTLRAAQALGRADEYGTLAAGKRADFAVIPLRDAEANDVEEYLLDESCDGRPQGSPV